MTSRTLKAQQAAVDSAQATLKVAQRQIDTLKAQRASAEASLAQAQAQRDQAALNLGYTTVIADQPGRVVNLTGAVGQYAQAGTNLSMFVPDEIWVVANYKETQLDRMRPGQPVDIEIDAYPERDFHGHVASVQPGSGTGLLAAAARKRHRQLRQDRPARAGQDHPRQSSGRCGARAGHVGRPDRARRPVALSLRAAEGPRRAMVEAGVSDATAQAGAPAAGSAASASPWLIAVLVALATFMEVLDTTIANVVLPYIAGGMGVSDDEASWVVTTYLVANAVSLTASPFLARALGRKAFFLICLGLFSVSSILCAQAWNLNSLLLFRILQGLAGGGMVPVSQSILAASFPPAKRGQAFALFGVAVVVAPVVGPTLGGWLADNWSWRWCFLINGPVGLATIALIAILLPADKPDQAQAARFDFIGFLLVATFLGALEIVLDRGLEDDWFGSNFIVTFTIICAIAFVLMIPWEMSRPDPMIDVRMVGSRQFGACFLVMAATGAILYATTQFLPLMLQTDFGYTATWAGLVLSPGGLVTMVMMFVVGNLSSRIQPKYLIMTGAIFVAISMYQTDQRVRRSRLLVLCPHAHGAWRRIAADLHPDHHRIV